MTDIHLAIFDCDGVLMDSEIVAASAELEIYSDFGIEMTPAEFSERFAGKDSALIKLSRRHHEKNSRQCGCKMRPRSKNDKRS